MPITNETYVLLEGTSAVIDPQFGIAGDTTVSRSARGYANQASMSFRRDTFSMTTFLTPGGWKVSLPRMKMATFALSGFMSTGGALSNPLALFNQNLPLPMVLSVTPPAAGATACTISCNVIETGEDDAFTALDTSGRQQIFESNGPVTTVWTVV